MHSTNKPTTFLWAINAGLVGGIAWIGGMLLLFGPAQTILANPEYQSQKFSYVMGQLEPLPYASEVPWILPAGLLLIGMLYGLAYHFIRKAFTGKPWWKRGIQFGFIGWLLMAPWFEFYLPWNVMHEPLPLIVLELVLWLAVLTLVGLAIAGTHEWRTTKQHFQAHNTRSSF